VSIVNARDAIDTVEWMKRERDIKARYLLFLYARASSVFAGKRERFSDRARLASRLSARVYLRSRRLKVVRSKMIETIDAYRVSISETARHSLWTIAIIARRESHKSLLCIICARAASQLV